MDLRKGSHGDGPKNKSVRAGSRSLHGKVRPLAAVLILYYVDRGEREENMKPSMLWVSVLLCIILFVGCTDRTDQSLIQVQRELEQSLQANIVKGDLRLQRAGDHLTLIISERLLFDAEGDEVKPDGIEVLQQLGNLMNAAPIKDIRVVGHGYRTSGSGSLNVQVSQKLALSKARATQAVRLLKDNGVDARKLSAEWYGNIRPIASNETEIGQRMNRRVEIVLGF